MKRWALGLMTVVGTLTGVGAATAQEFYSGVSGVARAASGAWCGPEAKVEFIWSSEGSVRLNSGGMAGFIVDTVVEPALARCPSARTVTITNIRRSNGTRFSVFQADRSSGRISMSEQLIDGTTASPRTVRQGATTRWVAGTDQGKPAAIGGDPDGGWVVSLSCDLQRHVLILIRDLSAGAPQRPEGYGGSLSIAVDGRDVARVEGGWIGRNAYVGFDLSRGVVHRIAGGETLRVILRDPFAPNRTAYLVFGLQGSGAAITTALGDCLRQDPVASAPNSGSGSSAGRPSSGAGQNKSCRLPWEVQYCQSVPDLLSDTSGNTPITSCAGRHITGFDLTRQRRKGVDGFWCDYRSGATFRTKEDAMRTYCK